MAGAPWWTTAFASHYRSVYAHRDDATAQAEILALLPLLRRVPGPVLDVGCGHGRHLEALLAHGIPAWGLDHSPALLLDGRERAACRGRLVRGDMRHPPVGSGWGAVLMLFTSFGYFSARENRACLDAWGGLLAAAGRLIIDLPEPRHLIATLQDSSCRQSDDGTEIRERRRLRHGRIDKEVQLQRRGADPLTYTESVQLYDRAAFTALARSVGLAVADSWRSLRGPGEDDHRLVWFLGRGSAT